MKAKTITFLSDKIVKRGDPEVLAVEVKKMILGREIGSRTGEFTVPKVIDYDDVKGILVMERMQQFGELRKQSNFMPRYSDYARRIGRALAAIHNSLQLPDSMKVSLPSGLSMNSNETFMHGDFSVANIGVDACTKEVIILDWQMTSLHGGVSTFGTRYFDVAWFLNNLFCKPPHQYFVAPFVNRAAMSFIQGYVDVCDNGFKQSELSIYLKDFTSYIENCRQRMFPLPKRVLLKPGMMLFRTFSNRLSEVELVSS